MTLIILGDKKYHLCQFDLEEDFEREIVNHAEEIFGKDSLLIDVKKKLKSRKSSIVSIPDGYVINVSTPDKPRLFILENELAEHDPFSHIGVQLMRFGTSYGSGSREVKQFLVKEIRKDPVKKEFINRAVNSSHFHNIDELIDYIVFDEPYSVIVVIDEITEDLNIVLNQLRNRPDVIEFKTYAEEGKEEYPESYVHRFTPFQQDIIEVTKDSKIRPEDVDTIVCPARTTGFKKVFLGEDRWYAIPISTSMIPRIKHIAIYQTAPTSAITWVGTVREIKPYQNTGKYEIVLLDKQKIDPIPLNQDKNAKVKTLRGPRYAKFSKIEKAKNLDEVFYG